jgi:SAM-dependent methyltransferase
MWRYWGQPLHDSLLIAQEGRMSEAREVGDVGWSYIGSGDPGEAQRLVAQEGGALEELRAALMLHHIPARAQVLELGCGNGVFTRALLAALPGATVTATDRDEQLLAAARYALAPEIASGGVRLEHAEAANLPYTAQSVDLVTCRCLLMHQPDPLLVVAEMFRVARVGGMALAIEPDWGARALYPDGEALAALLDLARRARPFGFPDLLLGRKLFALFRAGGFVDVQVRATAFSQTANTRPLPEIEQETAGPERLLEQGRTLLRSAGLADDNVVDELIARLAAAQRHPEHFSAGMDFAAVGLKLAPGLKDLYG